MVALAGPVSQLPDTQPPMNSTDPSASRTVECAARGDDNRSTGALAIGCAQAAAGIVKADPARKIARRRDKIIGAALPPREPQSSPRILSAPRSKSTRSVKLRAAKGN
jgi:hypothetical protein